MSVTTRPARAEDLPFLQQKINESNEEQVNLAQAFVFVVEEDGEIIGLIAARLGWFQIEPAYIWGGKTKNAKRRAMFQLFHAMKSWIADRTRNRSGIHSFWFVTKDDAVAKWAEKVGCLEIYKGCRTFGMDV
jgi:hypothetical protein